MHLLYALFLRAILLQCEITVSPWSAAPCDREVTLDHLSLSTLRDLPVRKTKPFSGIGLWNTFSGKKSNLAIFRTKSTINLFHLSSSSARFFIPLPSIGREADRSLKLHSVLSTGGQSIDTHLCTNQPIFQYGSVLLLKCQLQIPAKLLTKVNLAHYVSRG